MSHLDASLAHFPKITYSRYRKLTAYFSDLKNLWDAELSDMVAAGLEANIAQEFIDWREANPTDKIAERLAKEGITTISLGEVGYPKLLAEITDPPHTLFVRGTLPGCHPRATITCHPDENRDLLPPNSADLPTIAVVGSRKCSQYGKQVTTELTTDLAQRGMVIVSGLAYGIDGFAHFAALEAQGLTVAVLGSGVDRAHIMPVAHQQIAERIIAEGGAVISEYPPGFMPTSYSFPARNRIIAGLSLGTIVTEAAAESGALITAQCALDYNREVFAVPHPINSQSGQGCNNLIKQGAHLVTEANDIFEALNLKNLQTVIQNRHALPDNPIEEKILDTLSKQPKHIDTIIKESRLAGSVVTANLTMMEIKGQVHNLGGMKYVLGS